MDADSNNIKVKAADENPGLYPFGALDGSENSYTAAPDADSAVLVLETINTFDTPTILTVSFKSTNAASASLTAYKDGEVVEELRVNLFFICYFLAHLSRGLKVSCCDHSLSVIVIHLSVRPSTVPLNNIS